MSLFTFGEFSFREVPFTADSSVNCPLHLLSFVLPPFCLFIFKVHFFVSVEAALKTGFSDVKKQGQLRGTPCKGSSWHHKRGWFKPIWHQTKDVH